MSSLAMNNSSPYPSGLFKLSKPIIVSTLECEKLKAEIITEKLEIPYFDVEGKGHDYIVIFKLSLQPNEKTTITISERFYFNSKNRAVKTHMYLLELIINNQIDKYLKEASTKCLLDRENFTHI